MKVKNVIIRCDSQLVIYQLTGDFKCQSESVISQYEVAQELLEEFDQVELQYVNRMYNDIANELAQTASGYLKS